MSADDQPSVHLSDQSIDVLLTVAEITSLDEVPELTWTEATSWVGQLERPQEVAISLLDDVLGFLVTEHTWLA